MPQRKQSLNVCCSVMQCVAVCCSVLLCVVVCCSVLQCVAECCSVLQCVAVCCSVLQCVAVCCSVLWKHSIDVRQGNIQKIELSATFRLIHYRVLRASFIQEVGG